MESRRSARTARDLRLRNRVAVLRELYFGGAASRLDLARRTAVSPATVTNVVGELISDGVVIAAGQLDSEGGRPAVLVEVDPRHAAVVGVDLGETGAVVEVFDLALRSQVTVDLPLRQRITPEAFAALTADGVAKALATMRPAPAGVLGVGVGVPGIVEHVDEPLVHTPSLGWEGAPLRTLLAEAIGEQVLLDNGAKTMGRAEAWFGAGRGVQNLVVALIGTGVGAAVVADGHVLRGAAASAGEWGHTKITMGGAGCRCGATGCLEAYVGAPAILARYRSARRRTQPQGMGEREALAALVAAVDAGERAATRVLDETARHLGVGVANLVNLLSPEKIVIGGWVGLALGERLLSRLVPEVERSALRPAFRRVSIELCHLGPDAVALGAATLVVERFLNAGGVHDPTVRRRRRTATD